MDGVLTFRSERMRRTGARSNASGISSPMQSWADCITGTLESSYWKRQAPAAKSRDAPASNQQRKLPACHSDGRTNDKIVIVRGALELIDDNARRGLSLRDVVTNLASQ